MRASYGNGGVSWLRNRSLFEFTCDLRCFESIGSRTIIIIVIVSSSRAKQTGNHDGHLCLRWYEWYASSPRPMNTTTAPAHFVTDMLWL